MTDIELEIKYLKGEIKSMHRMGLLVPSSTYERLHRLEKALEKMQKGESSNDNNVWKPISKADV